MDYQEVYVSRQLIKYHFQHPELYGESMVELINCMVTDVYTHDEGYLHTPTNDQALIDYLDKNKKPDLLINKSFDEFTIRSLNIKDKPLIKQWLYKDDSVDDETVIFYLSHGFTSCSHIFMLEKENKPFGIFGFNLFNSDLVFSLHIDDHYSITTVINMIIPFLKTKHNFNKLFPTVKENETAYQEVLKDLDFTLNTEKSNNLNHNKLDKSCRLFERMPRNH